MFTLSHTYISKGTQTTHLLIDRFYKVLHRDIVTNTLHIVEMMQKHICFSWFLPLRIHRRTTKTVVDIEHDPHSNTKAMLCQDQLKAADGPLKNARYNGQLLFLQQIINFLSKTQDKKYKKPRVFKHFRNRCLFLCMEKKVDAQKPRGFWTFVNSTEESICLVM